MKTEKTFTFRIPTELLDKAHKEAAALDLTVAQLMRRLIKDFLEAQNHAN